MGFLTFALRTPSGLPVRTDIFVANLLASFQSLLELFSMPGVQNPWRPFSPFPGRWKRVLEGASGSRLGRGSRFGQELSGLLWQVSELGAGTRNVGGLTDELLVSRWQEGDRMAFEALVRRYQHVAYTVCFRYLRNPQSAEETAQDVFVSLFRKLHEFRGESSFKSWFYRVLTNHCHNRHKAGVRRAEQRHDSIDAPREPDDEHSGRTELPDQSPDPETRLVESQRQALIDASLADIGDEARLILLLREGQGMAYEDIADALRLNPGTVKSRIHRARAELKAAVERRMASAGISRLG